MRIDPESCGRPAPSMEPFLLTLDNNARLSGLASLPSRTTTTPRYCPLIVAIHGGTYASTYFDASPDHSGRTFSAQLGIPFIAIDRPGYNESTPLPSIPPESTFFQEEGKYVHRFILPKIWDIYGKPSGASTIVLLGHSLGSSAAIIVPALHAQVSAQRYPLAGTIVSGRTVTSSVTRPAGEKQLAEARRIGYVEFPQGAKDAIMFGDVKYGLASEHMRRISETITHRGLVGEFEDRRLHWDNYWHAYAGKVKVPVMAAIGERDGLHQASEKDLREYTSWFKAASKVETLFLPGAPHCLELSHWSTAWYSRCFGFAVECSTTAALARP
jgi:pimeloyl-ACP methyl ester carboxylesterase